MEAPKTIAFKAKIISAGEQKDFAVALAAYAIFITETSYVMNGSNHWILRQLAKVNQKTDPKLRNSWSVKPVCLPDRNL